MSRENGTEVAQALSALGDTFHALALQFQNLADQLEPARKRWQDTEWAILNETHLHNPSAVDLLDFARSATEDPARVVYEDKLVIKDQLKKYRARQREGK